MYSCTLSDLFETFAHVETWILGEVTYGACCVDDFTAKALGCDFLIHYGHSCLISVDTMLMKSMYIFVEIDIDVEHFSNTLRYNFEFNKLIGIEFSSQLILMSTIQFVSSLQKARSFLIETSSSLHLHIPQSKPLSPGELLGCTAPSLSSEFIHSSDSSREQQQQQQQQQLILIYVGDGRFHLEALMIANPNLIAYCYNPYNKVLSREYYDHHEMQRMRYHSIQTSTSASTFGLILGTLGRQGSLRVLNELENRLKTSLKSYRIILLSEITPEKLQLFFHEIPHKNEPDAWIQTACPRLSIDWGHGFSKPLLTPYELQVALSLIQWQQPYPMDYYATKSLGPWTPRHNAPH